MRVSTSMIYQTGVATMQRQAAQMLHTQQQVATGRRILSPADDPIGAARALEVTQSQTINAQYMSNQGYANDNLSLLDGRLAGAVEVLQYVRERAVQAGGVLTQSDLSNMAIDIRAQFDALLAIANAQDANSEFVFAGFKSQTQPFQGSLGAISYEGDQGVRTMQVASSRYMPISLPGSDVFINSGAAHGEVTVRAGSGDSPVEFGSGTPIADGIGARYRIEFAGPGPQDFVVTRLRPGAAEVALVPTYDANPPTELTVDGMTFNVAATPEIGDSAEVFVASNSVFENLAVFIDALERPGPSGMAGGAVGFALQSLDAGLSSVSRARSQIGSQQVELDNLRDVGTDLDLQYAQTLSRIQDVDMAEAISRLTQQQTFLEASQASFVRVTGMSLFNFIN